MIAIVLLTYDRMDYAKKTIASVAKNLKLPPGEDVWFHIADDGSEQEYRDALWEIAKKHWGENVSMTNSERRGYGASYNAATQLVHGVADLILPLEDDWELIRKLDLTPIAAALRSDVFGCVRMGYIGTTQLLRASFVKAQDLWWLGLDPDSAEPHVFAGHPRLESVEWERYVGPWPEGIGAGATEFEVAHRREARKGVAWPVDLIRPSGDAFVHIGAVQA